MLFSCVFVVPNVLAKPALDARSFADEVISFHEGMPAARNKANDNAPALVLGAPYHSDPSLTLGCGGVLVVRFVDNALIDVKGDDLYIFEIGPNIEATQVSISNNAKDWISIGQVAGSTAGLDIHDYVSEGQSFRYVRLRDLKQSCDSSTPGADIDAIGAIGSAARYHFSDDVLFDFDQSDLKAKAKQVLLHWLKDFQGQTGRLQIHGHSDQRGDNAYNMTLSEKRAQAVAAFLQGKLKKGIRIEPQGFGESQPLSLLGTAQSDAKNRRVEMIYVSD
ncbi:MAG: OmpA family protein [Mariprofundaceae bacterium]|nr:OmpA family protein [Mariprofundaceae bacterium]